MRDREQVIHGEFTVGREIESGETTFFVELPHQCDEWTITWTEDPVEAVEMLDSFIANAQAARKLLVEVIEANRPNKEPF